MCNENNRATCFNVVREKVMGTKFIYISWKHFIDFYHKYKLKNIEKMYFIVKLSIWTVFFKQIFILSVYINEKCMIFQNTFFDSKNWPQKALLSNKN